MFSAIPHCLVIWFHCNGKIATNRIGEISPPIQNLVFTVIPAVKPAKFNSLCCHFTDAKLFGYLIYSSFAVWNSWRIDNILTCKYYQWWCSSWERCMSHGAEHGKHSGVGFVATSINMWHRTNFSSERSHLAESSRVPKNLNTSPGNQCPGIMTFSRKSRWPFRH